MGLDMFLNGKKFHWTDWKNPENNLSDEGFRVAYTVVELGYWRKHPNLHGYIVKTFAEGVDECQDIRLDADKILQILDAVRKEKLPHTEGFFFGSSENTNKQKDYDVKILTDAYDWLIKDIDGISKSIIYRASW